MIYLQANQSVTESKVGGVLKKFPIDVKLDVDLISGDITRLDNIDLHGKTANYIANLNNTADYLENIKKAYLRSKDRNSGKIRIYYTVFGNKLRSTPIELVKIPLFNIETSDYMIIDPEAAIIDVCYERLLSSIAFSYVYADIGVDLDNIEERLESLDVIQQHTPELLYKMIDDEEITYKQARKFRVEECPQYVSPDKKYIYSFFGDRLNYNGFYEEVINFSNYKAMLLITNIIFNTFMSYKDTVGVAGVYEDGIKVIVNDKNKMPEVIQIINDSIGLKIFGRYFKCTPEINVIRYTKEGQS